MPGRGNKEFIPCPPDIFEQCRVFEKEGECYEDVHHDYYPHPDYKTPVEREFRGLEINQKFMCRALHNAIHAQRTPPEKPPRKEMLEVIHKEKRKK